MVAGRLGRNTVQVIDAKEGDDRHHSQHEQRPARDLDLPGIACEEGFDSPPKRQSAFPKQPKTPNNADNRKDPKRNIQAGEQVVVEGQEGSQ